MVLRLATPQAGPPMADVLAKGDHMPESLSVTDNRTGRSYELPIENGAVRATDFQQIKVDSDEHGLLLYDPAFLNTASCQSRITYIDGDRGILLYRGYPIEQLAEQSNF